MSVGLLITHKNSDIEDVYFPVATESIYRQYWQFAGKKLNLSWIVAFQTGTVVPRENYPQVISEFEKLREYLHAKPDKRYSQDIVQFMVERLDGVLQWLSYSANNDSAEVFIG